MTSFVRMRKKYNLFSLEKTRVRFRSSPTDQKSFRFRELSDGSRTFRFRDRRRLRTRRRPVLWHRGSRWESGQPTDRFLKLLFGRKFEFELSDSGLGVLEFFVELRSGLGHRVRPQERVGDDLRGGRSQVLVLANHRLKTKKEKSFNFKSYKSSSDQKWKNLTVDLIQHQLNFLLDLINLTVYRITETSNLP